MNDYGLNNDKRNYLLDFFKGVAAIGIVHKKEAFLSRSVKIMAAECIISTLLMFISVNVLIAGIDISQLFKIEG